MVALYLPLAAGILSTILAFFMLRKTLSYSAGSEKMKKISGYIQEGSETFLNQEAKKIFLVAIFIAAVLGIVFSSFTYPICLLFGALVSEFAGVIGMKTATRANARVAEGAKQGLSQAFKVAFSGGSVMGLSVAGFSLTGLVIVMLVFKDSFVFETINGIQKTGSGISYIDAVMLLSSYSLGASLIALFDRVGGGMYTKAADMSADLVGKTEANLPEDDPRNPATIADNVGANVGDVAGLGADILESYVASVISAIILTIFMRIADTNLAAGSAFVMTESQF